MGKFHLPARYLVGLLCAAAAAFPAVASTVSVDVSPTTGYTVTNRTTTALPPRATSGPIANYNPTLGPLAGGGAYQTTSSGITITGINGGTASTTMSGRVTATASAMAGAFKRCVTSMRCNVALTAGAAGVQALINGIGGLIENGGQISRIEKIPTYQEGDYCWSYGNRVKEPCYASIQAAVDGEHGSGVYVCKDISISVSGTSGTCHLYTVSDDRYMGVPSFTRSGDGCQNGFYDPSTGMCVTETTGPFPPDELTDAIDSSYTPAPSDLPYLNGGMDWSDPGVNFDITDIPPAASDSSTFTTYPDGTSKGSQTQFDFSWSNNPSKQPNVSVDETTTETTYSETGQPTGTTTTTTTTTGTGGGQPSNNDIEIPTDCDFMPTVCRFLEWFQEPDPETSQDVDITQLIDNIDIERDFQVGSSTAACPAPFQISLAWVPSVEVSLQPFCDLADLLRPFLLSLCFLYSGMIILRT